MAHYLVYWKPPTVLANQPNDVLGHSASNQYNKIRVGDILWIVTSEAPDDLLLVGCQQVDMIVGQLEAEQILETDGLWQADYHVICDEPEEKAYINISRWAHQLSFDGVVDCLPGGFTGQHLQTMRRLDWDSIRLMERLWEMRDEVVASD